MNSQAGSMQRNLREAVRRSAKTYRLLHTPLDVAKTAWKGLWVTALVLGVIAAGAYWLAWRLDLGGF